MKVELDGDNWALVNVDKLAKAICADDVRGEPEDFDEMWDRYRTEYIRMAKSIMNTIQKGEANGA